MEENAEWIDTMLFEDEIKENAGYYWDHDFSTERFGLAVANRVKQIEVIENVL